MAACLARHKGIDPIRLRPGLYRHNVQSLRVVVVARNDGKGTNLTAGCVTASAVCPIAALSVLRHWREPQHLIAAPTVSHI